MQHIVPKPHERVFHLRKAFALLGCGECDGRVWLALGNTDGGGCCVNASQQPCEICELIVGLGAA